MTLKGLWRRIKEAAVPEWFGRSALGVLVSALLIIIFILGSNSLKWIFPSDWKNPETELPGLAGKVIHCNASLVLARHAEILGYGLDDPRGLAYDSQHKRILIADGPRRRIVAYSIQDNGFEKPAPKTESDYCPEGSCGAVDVRGLAFFKDRLYAAEHERGRLGIRTIENGYDQEDRPDFTQQEKVLRGPSGIVFDQLESTAFVTDDLPWPGFAKQPTIYDSADYSRWLDHDKAQARLLGAVYSIEINKGDGGQVTLIDANLPHPSGVALWPDGKSLYVTTCDGYQTQWVIFKKDKDQWERSGVLTTEKVTDGVVPPYQGVLIGEGGRHIYAAGPGGIHVFNSAGVSLGRMEFYGRVTGLAWGFDTNSSKPYLYFAAGHTLCRLSMEKNPDFPKNLIEGQTASKPGQR